LYHSLYVRYYLLLLDVRYTGIVVVGADARCTASPGVFEPRPTRMHSNRDSKEARLRPRKHFTVRPYEFLPHSV